MPGGCFDLSCCDLHLIFLKAPAGSKKRAAVSSEGLDEEQTTNKATGDVDGSKPPKPAKRARLAAASSPSPPLSPILKVTFSFFEAFHIVTLLNFQEATVLSPGMTKELIVSMPSHPTDAASSQPYMFDSQEEARKLFECLLHPVKSDKFFQ